MLKIGKLTDYALLIISHLALSPVSIMSATQIAERLRLPAPTVSKILKILGEAGLVSSLRGAEGGYRLVRQAETITVADVITGMEGKLALTDCCDKSAKCKLSKSCTMRANWQQINGYIYSFLANVSITDMVAGPLSSERFFHGK